jgi:hypothetical protein
LECKKTLLDGLKCKKTTDKITVENIFKAKTVTYADKAW